MEIFKRPVNQDAARFADLLDAVLAQDAPERAVGAADDLQPLLRVSVLTRDALQVEPARTARQEARRAMLNRAAAKATGAGGSFQVPGFATAGAVSAAVMLASLFGTVNAAEAALPGDLLYPLKGALEETLLALTPSEAARLQLKIDFANKRTGELEALHEQQREVTLDALERMADRIQDVVTASRALPPDSPQLRQVANLGQKSLEVLNDVSSRVPEQAKPALEHAISASQQAHPASSPAQRESGLGSPNAADGRQDGPRVGGGQSTATPSSTPVTLMPAAASGPSRAAADRNGGAGGSAGKNDDNAGRGAPSATPTPDGGQGRGGRNDDNSRGGQGSGSGASETPGRGEPAQDGGRGGSGGNGERLPVVPPQGPGAIGSGTGPNPSATSVPAPVAPPSSGSTSVDSRRTRPDDDDRRPEPSPTPRPAATNDDASGPSRGGRDDSGSRQAPTAVPTAAPAAAPAAPPAAPTASPAQPSPTAGSNSGPSRNQRDGDDSSGRGQSDNPPAPRGNSDDGRGNQDDGNRNRSPQASPTPEPPRGGGNSGPQRGRN